MNPNNPMSTPAEPNNQSALVQVAGIDTSTHKVFGVPRRAIAFGFALFFMLVVLAFVYSQFVKNKMPVGTNTEMMPASDMPAPEKQMSPVEVITGPVTPDMVADDLIDEALSDRDDLSGYDSDEMADIEDGSNH